MLKVVHYINQFFAGLGGEDKAEIGPQLSEGHVGPGMAIQKALGDRGEIVATVICGDNYFAENIMVSDFRHLWWISKGFRTFRSGFQ